MNSFVRKVGKFIIFLLIALLGNTILNIVLVAPRSKKRVLFIGNNGKFRDNVKYLYLFKENYKLEKYFLTLNKKYYFSLKDRLENVVLIPSLKGFFLLITSKYIVVDNINWSLVFKGLIYFLTKKSLKVQLWHGYPIKKIEYDNKKDITLQRCKKRETFIDWILYFFYKTRCINYDFLLIPTKNTKMISIFNRAFEFKFRIVAGYPRNEYLLYPNRFKNWDNFIDLNYYQSISSLKSSNKKIVGFLPTFRDNGSIVLNEDELAELDNFAKDQNVIFVIKPHPWDLAFEKFLKKRSFSNILRIERDEDIYPYLKEFDMLISDISSIVFDFLLLDKPIIHYFPDKKEYLKGTRDTYFDLEEIKVSPLCENVKELCENIKELLITDVYKNKRRKIKDMIFGNIEHNSNYIYRTILQC